MTRNCGFCGRPVFTDGQPICAGCMKSRARADVKKQRKFDREFIQKEKDKETEQLVHEEEDEDAEEVWAK
ncbi:MAG: hypothetical protein ABH851_02835 [Methanobacteriota archaeon]